MTPPANKLQSVTEELERLKSEQDKAMSLAVYVGTTKEEAKRHDERRKRIYELYEALLVLKGTAMNS